MAAGKTVVLTNYFWGANDNLIEVVSARTVVAVKGAVTTTLAASTGIAENSGLSSNVLVVVLDKKANGNSSAEAMGSRSVAETGDANTFKKLLLVMSRRIETCRTRKRKAVREAICCAGKLDRRDRMESVKD